MLKPSLIAKNNPIANENQIYIGNNYRVTVLTDKLIRFEFSQSKQFVDLASFAVWFRNFDAQQFSVSENSGKIVIETQSTVFTVNKSNGKPLTVKFKDTGTVEKCFKKDNLGGTKRTLDMSSGAVKLQDGLITKSGVYVLDDSKSLLLDSDGMFKPRDNKNDTDCYIFAYGKDYRATVNAFYQISSPVPIVPRYALGVWWSRYHKYTQQEYLDLMDRFKAEHIPVTVATIDMDWHWVDIKKDLGVDYGGWTGYSWNTNFFPDYKAMLKKLKEDNLHITLNLHPADGVRHYEDMYEQMAKAVDMDPAKKEPVPFKCGSAKHWNAYFDVLHKPYEADGVDFWWIDWQQGLKSDMNGLDPLVALNHYHYHDNAENGQLPMILSRYAGLGSHRYPLGFSGDTWVNWKVLDFQPYFTNTAANAAYTWWSHDIGGHMFGVRDDDLYLRWVQYGVFSPILRLHSTQNPMGGKEPWKYRDDVFQSARKFLRLRHSLIPYIYTMDYLTHKNGLALCEPMYYTYTNHSKAYEMKNQYMFGTNLMVCPITQKQDKITNYGSVNAWIPEGRWTDIFTNQSYVGDKTVVLNRDISNYPVLAKEGTILPLASADTNDVSNPEKLDFWVYSGNGSFTLYEDNGQVDFDNHNCQTKFDVTYTQNGTLTVKINKPFGDLDVVPKNRQFTFIFKDIEPCNVTSKTHDISVDYDGFLTVKINDYNGENDVVITLENAVRKSADKMAKINELLSRCQGMINIKTARYASLNKAKTPEEISKNLAKSCIPKSVKNAICEILEME